MRPELHPACAAFPTAPDHELRALAEDIRLHGLIEAITLTPDGLLLDGKTRWDACEIAGVEQRTEVHDGDPIAYVISKNRHRRHMTKSQMGLVMAELARLPRGRPKVKGQALAIFTTDRLASESGVSKSFIKYGRQLLDNAAPNIIQMVKDGAFGAEIAVAAATAYSKKVQATWTVEEARCIGSQIVQARPSNLPLGKRDRPSQPKAVAPVTARLAEPQPTASVVSLFPTAEETGMPVNGTLEELNAFHEEYGRTPLHPKTFTDMSRHKRVVESASFAVALADERLADIDGLLDRLDQLLAYVPDKTKTNGLETDFAAIARRLLARMEKHLPGAIARLTELAARLETRRADRGAA